MIFLVKIIELKSIQVLQFPVKIQDFKIDYFFREYARVSRKIKTSVVISRKNSRF